MREPSDVEMWRSVEATVRDVLLPSIADDWARVIAVQLVGMARFAATRPADPIPARVAELTEALDRLAGNPVVAPHWATSGPRRGAGLDRGQRRAGRCGLATRRRRTRSACQAARPRQPPTRRRPRRHRHADALLPRAAPRCVTRSSAGSASSSAPPRSWPICVASPPGTRGATGSWSSPTALVSSSGSSRVASSGPLGPSSSSSCRRSAGSGFRSPRCAGWNRLAQ